MPSNLRGTSWSVVHGPIGVMRIDSITLCSLHNALSELNRNQSRRYESCNRGWTRSQGNFTTTGRILFYKSSTKLLMHFFEFLQWLLPFNIHKIVIYCPTVHYGTLFFLKISRNCETFSIRGWFGIARKLKEGEKWLVRGLGRVRGRFSYRTDETFQVFFFLFFFILGRGVPICHDKKHRPRCDGFVCSRTCLTGGQTSMMLYAYGQQHENLNTQYTMKSLMI